MLFLVISSPRPEQPSTVRGRQKEFWDWIDRLVKDGTARHVWTKLGRGAVVVFDVDSHETMHKLVNQWSECVPASFEVIPMLGREHQEAIARAGTAPMSL